MKLPPDRNRISDNEIRYGMAESCSQYDQTDNVVFCRSTKYRAEQKVKWYTF
jgi:hypothetical protein